METFKFNDGGRSKYFNGSAGDCVVRAIAITSGKDYKEVYDMLAQGNAKQRKGKRDGSHVGKKTARMGINTTRKWFKDLMISMGYEWVATMNIGEGCKTHLRPEELPEGRIICKVTKHFTAVIDGVINDTYDPSRDGTRCVYGYWIYKGDKKEEEKYRDKEDVKNGSSFEDKSSSPWIPLTKKEYPELDVVVFIRDVWRTNEGEERICFLSARLIEVITTKKKSNNQKEPIEEVQFEWSRDTLGDVTHWMTIPEVK